MDYSISRKGITWAQTSYKVNTKITKQGQTESRRNTIQRQTTTTWQSSNQSTKINRVHLNQRSVTHTHCGIASNR
uniref:Uncharacterized protein n=1 Tax=Populus trichocarpa TaxID=3694 RepID=A0A3N7G4A1_POPTR